MERLIVCLKVGTKYDAGYVNRLVRMVRRHSQKTDGMVCITDNPAGLDLPTMPVLVHPKLNGWWHKVGIFGAYKFDAKRILFMDLDTVILQDIDFLWDYEGPFAILRDFYFPSKYGSAIMSFPNGYYRHIWDNFVLDPFNAMRGRDGDQDWILTMMPKVDLWQDLFPGKIVSYKVHCEQGVPVNAAIVCFHGEPRPHQVADLPWMKEHWNAGN